MDYKTILVHIDRSPRRSERLSVGLQLAEAFNAHLVALYALSPLRIPTYALSAPAEALLEAADQDKSRALEEAKAAFESVCRHSVGVAAEWRSSDDDALEAVLVSARYSDLVIVGQHDRYADQDSGMQKRFVDELVVTASRPVLVVPYAGHFAGSFKKILIAWNASRPATRAVNAALPLLQRADEVRVAVFDPDKRDSGHGEIPGADVALHLARHSVKALVTEERSPNAGVGTGILSRAADFGSELIVMGAYSHSRTRERILGGATRTMLDCMTVPVLMSH